MRNTIKIVLSIFLFLCLLRLPYGYYQFVRFFALVSFAALAYFAYKEKNIIEMLICVALAVLFQPFVKIALGRELWNIVDVIVGIALIISVIISIFISMKKKKKNYVARS